MNTQAGGHIFKCGGLLINDENKEVTVDGELIKLTPIEYNILLLLVRNAGKVFSIDQIYEEIWNEEAIGADNTVAVHIRPGISRLYGESAIKLRNSSYNTEQVII